MCVPYLRVLQLCALAQQVHQVHYKDIVSRKFVEKVRLFNRQRVALAICKIAASVRWRESEERVGLKGERRRQLLDERVATVGRDAFRGQLSTHKQRQAVARRALRGDSFAVGVAVEHQLHFVEYGCNFVFAHALKIGQAHKAFVHCGNGF